jgi:translation initiation factor 1
VVRHIHRPDLKQTRLAYSTEPASAASTPAQTVSIDRAGIRLRLESRPGGRAVTLVTGLVGRVEDLAAFAKAVKAACNAGGTLRDGVLEIQGDHRARIETLLAARGLRARRSGG